MDLWLNETRVERAQLINDRKCQKLGLECNFLYKQFSVSSVLFDKDSFFA